MRLDHACIIGRAILGFASITGILVAVSGAASADALPKSGSIQFHTGSKASVEVLEVAPNHLQGHGRDIGVTFNDKGSGPLHHGAFNCFYTFEMINGKGPAKIFCTFSDADGDRIFTDASGVIGPADGPEGTNTITGGTGKYAGVKGSGPWKCNSAGSSGEWYCHQRFDYQLP
jgi:hypothetical protein